MDLVERLTEHKTLGSVPREELEWLAEHGSIRHLNTGDVLSHKGQPVDSMYVLLSGRQALFIDRGAGPQKMVEWRGGDVTGNLPYSRLVSPPGSVIAQEPTEILAVHRDLFPEMTRVCFEVTSRLVHLMLDRARLFNANELQNEKMVSLGKLSAGLAHELNNPASAIERNVSALTDRLEDSEDASLALGAARLTDSQLSAIVALRERCLVWRKLEPSPLEQMDREEAIAEWLAARGLDLSNAQLLADTEVTLAELNAVAESVQGPALNAALRWAASSRAVRSLASEVRGAAMRISSLVYAVKGFTHMDQAMIAEPLDVKAGLCNAVTVLNAKASQKSVTVTIEIADELPQVVGYAAELNQVWGNIIDNALDAVLVAGCVRVNVRREEKHVVVRVIDNGPGIPAEIRSKVFDPFFTTKPMGQGTGLGLDIARRLVQHNDGVIEFDSEPGLTEFRVSLPGFGVR